MDPGPEFFSDLPEGILSDEPEISKSLQIPAARGAAGAMTYEGRPCKRGHTMRYANGTRGCVECNHGKDARRRAEFWKKELAGAVQWLAANANYKESDPLFTDFANPGPIERFAKNFTIGGGAECWEWLGSKDRDGYGKFAGPNSGRAHRTSYEIVHGEIPGGLTLDHLCRNRGCVNPDHLEPVTMKVNLHRGESIQAKNARKTHCKRGHDLANARITSVGGRECRECRSMRHYRRKR